jgi:hypothetical protein
MKRLRFALPIFAVLASVIATGIPAPSRATSTLVPTFATWSSGTTGTLGAANISVSSVGSTIIQSLDFDLSDFDPQGPNSLDTLNYAADSSFEVTFDVPVTNLAIYYRYMRGTTDGFTSFEMNSGAASGTWSVLSGLSGASMVCNYYLNISSTTNAYLDGIVKFTGTLTSIHFGSIGGTTSSLQALTFATLEEPPAPTTSTTLAQTTTTTMSTERQTPSFAC